MNAQQLKNAILQEAIQGRLVPQDPNDEPASVLLQRIRKEKEKLVKEGKLKKKDLEETPISEDEKPFEIPKGWEWVRIEAYTNKVTDFVASGSFASLRKNVKYYCNKEYAILVRTKDFQTDFQTDLVYTDKHGYEYLENSNLFGGELILPNIGASIGKVFIVPSINYRMTLAPNSIMIKFVEDCQKDWVYILFLSLFGKNLLYEISSSTAQGKFNKTDFKKLVIPIPPLAEQRRIVSKIEELLPKVEAYGRAQESLDKLNAELPDRLKKSILQEAIEGRFVPQDPNDEPASVLLERIRAEKKRLVKEGKLKKKDLEETPISEDEKPFEIPESWEWCKIENITVSIGNKKNQILSKEILNEGKVPVVSQGQKLIDGYSNEDEKTIHELPLIMFGDHTRNVKLIDFPFVIGADGTKFFKPILCNPKYIYYVVLHIASKIRNRGYQRHYILLKNEVFPLPPLSEQHRIVSKIEQLLKEIDKLNK